MSKIIIAGCRHFGDYDKFKQFLLHEFFQIHIQPNETTEIIAGGARGADYLAYLFSKERELRYTEFKADWETHGKAAGFIRNKRMADYAGPHGILIAFWDGESKGTANMIAQATQNKMTVRIIPI